MQLETKLVSGEQFGYPSGFGDATVTYLDGNPVAIVFENGVVEARAYSGSVVTRAQVSIAGTTVITDVG